MTSAFSTRRFRASQLLLSLGTLFGAAVAHGAMPFNAGDLLISFRATGANGNSDQTYTFNLGAATDFRDQLTLGLVGSIGTDLATAFGANWATRTDIYWSAIGNYTNAPSGGVTNGDPVRTIYATNDQTTLGEISTAPVISAGATRGTASTQIQTYVTAFSNATPSANPRGSIIPVSATNDYTEFGLDTVQDFGSTFGGDGVEANSALGVTNTALDLFRILNTNATANPTGPIGTGTYEGTFTINSAGEIYFSVIPEPSAMGLLGFGVLLYSGVARLRRRQEPARA